MKKIFALVCGFIYGFVALNAFATPGSSLVTASSLTSSIIIPGTTIDGDINGDGVINVMDAIIGLQGIINPNLMSDEQRLVGDIAPVQTVIVEGKVFFHGDGKFDVLDVIRMLRIAVGLDDAKIVTGWRVGDLQPIGTLEKGYGSETNGGAVVNNRLILAGGRSSLYALDLADLTQPLETVYAPQGQGDHDYVDIAAPYSPIALVDETHVVALTSQTTFAEITLQPDGHEIQPVAVYPGGIGGISYLGGTDKRVLINAQAGLLVYGCTEHGVLARVPLPKTENSFYRNRKNQANSISGSVGANTENGQIWMADWLSGFIGEKTLSGKTTIYLFDGNDPAFPVLRTIHLSIPKTNDAIVREITPIGDGAFVSLGAMEGVVYVDPKSGFTQTLKLPSDQFGQNGWKVIQVIKSLDNSRVWSLIKGHGVYDPITGYTANDPFYLAELTRQPMLAEPSQRLRLTP